jgi:hypothetical protein
MLFMTIPTAGNRTKLLNELIADSGLPRNQIIIIATKPDLAFPEGVRVIEDLGPPNIQRWWALGIAAAEDLGATAVAVLNDDVRISGESLSLLHSALTKTGAAIACPSRPGFRNGVHKRPLIPYEPRIWGSIWMLDLATPLRPDPRYQWWYGDNDLDLRARAHFGGVVLEEVPYEHVHATEATFSSPDLITLVDEDALRFERQYGRILKLTRVFNRLRGRVKR